MSVFWIERWWSRERSLHTLSGTLGSGVQTVISRHCSREEDWAKEAGHGLVAAENNTVAWNPDSCMNIWQTHNFYEENRSWTGEIIFVNVIRRLFYWLQPGQKVWCMTFDSCQSWIICYVFKHHKLCFTHLQGNVQKHTKPSLNLSFLYLQEDTTSYTFEGTREF